MYCFGSLIKYMVFIITLLHPHPQKRERENKNIKIWNEMSILSYYAPLPHIASFPPLWHKSKPVPKNKQTKTKLF